MVNILSNDGDVRYGIKEYVCDTPADVADLPTTANPGSAAIVISTGTVYMLNSEGKWVEVCD